MNICEVACANDSEISESINHKVGVVSNQYLMLRDVIRRLMLLLDHSLTYSPIHSLTHSLTHSLDE